jgi:GNAT superfamily N-acetyltransferase
VRVIAGSLLGDVISENISPDDPIEVPEAPTVSGLEFRGFRGSEDYPKMHKVIVESDMADKSDFLETLDDLIRNYKYLANCDPYRDMLLAEVNGEVIGYSRVWWTEKLQRGLNYNHFVVMAPDWRGRGVRKAMLRWNEHRLCQIAGSHDKETSKEYQVWTSEHEADWTSLIESEGYKPVRYSFIMVRPDLENIPEIPLPEDLEVRPVKPGDYRKIWEADVEASRDSWEMVKMTEVWYQYWLNSHEFQPELWQVAWDGDRVAGAVQPFINEEENGKFSRKRGYPENIHVGREWRKKGVAKALIARSLRLLKEKGMEEACLGVDAENPTGALHVYQSMGFEEIKRYMTYRKPLSK